MTASEAKFEQILKRITSDDLDVLQLCNNEMDSILVSESMRGERGEDRAQNLLSACGIGAAILAGFAGLIYNHEFTSLGIPVWILYFAAVILLAKAAYCALRAVGPLKSARMTPSFIFEVQKDKLLDAIRYDIAAKVWILEENKALNTLKLFRLHRAIRNITVLIWMILATGGSLLFIEKVASVTPSNLAVCVSTFLALLILGGSVILDPIVEKLGNFWN